MARPKRICLIPECGKPRHGAGYCMKHYYRFKRRSDPLFETNVGKLIPWIKDQIAYEGQDCLPWPFARGRRGDGVVTFRDAQMSAAKVMCILAHGEPPTPDHEAAHSCGNGHEVCMNQRHIRWATRSENMLEKHEHNTMTCGEKSNFAKLTEAQVREIRSLKGKHSLTELGAMFNVHRATISLIHLRKNWGWLSD